jgi:hypothetical protein
LYQKLLRRETRLEKTDNKNRRLKAHSLKNTQTNMQASNKQRITTKHEVSSYYKKDPFEISHGGDRTN